MADRGGIGLFAEHGGRVEAARAAFGGSDWIDLSTGIAPWAYPLPADMPAALVRLPEPRSLAALATAAGEAFGAAPAYETVAVPGSDLALRLLAQIMGTERAAVLSPGYAGHRAAWPEAAAVARAEEARRHRLLVLADPANPDGGRHDPAALARMADEGMTVIVDEAFADASDECRYAGSGHERIVVLRSFGKFYGLAGLRLGFVIATPAIARALRALLGDWPVSGAAIAIGTAAYRDGGWRSAQRLRIAEAGRWLDAALGEITTIGRADLFRLLAVPDAWRLFRHLAAHAILTRPFAERPDRLRIGLPRDLGAVARLAGALAAYRP